MSDNRDISRRKALATTGGIGGSILSIPAIAAADSDDPSDRPEAELELTEDEVERALAETPVVAARKEEGQETLERDGELDIHESAVPDDVDIFIGEHQNAEVPTGKPYAIESKDEWLEREAPPGFDGEEGELETHSVPQLYFQEDFGSVSVGGYSIEVGIGVGIQGNLSTITPGASVDVSFDLYINGVTFSLLSQTVEVGVTEEGLCIDRLGLDYSYIPELLASGCIDIGIEYDGGSADNISVFGSVDFELCGNVCSPFNCSVCGGVGGSISYP